MKARHWKHPGNIPCALGLKEECSSLRYQPCRSHEGNTFPIRRIIPPNSSRNGVGGDGSISQRHPKFPSFSSPHFQFLKVHRRQHFGRVCSRKRSCVFLPLIALVACLVRPAVALVIEEPFQATFEHVPAAFGPDALLGEPPLESRPLIKARPRDACDPLSGFMEDGGIALVERGTCNFTQKVLHAQEAGASAVVVTDTRLTDNWWMLMYGDAQQTQGIEIPAVLISQEAGQRLWNTRSWLGSGKMRASINATGHVVLRTPPIGILETLGIYVLLSVLLLGFSGICGLVFALTYTWYQRGARARAMRKLKSFAYHRGELAAAPVCSSAEGVNHDAPRSREDEGDSAERDSTRVDDNNGVRTEDDTCAICLDAYEEGDNLTGLPCKHSFHSHCIRKWLSGTSGLCPMCKRETFSRGGLLWMTIPQLEAAFTELAELCTDNLAVLVSLFVASVACGLVAAKISLDA